MKTFVVILTLNGPYRETKAELAILYQHAAQGFNLNHRNDYLEACWRNQQTLLVIQVANLV